MSVASPEQWIHWQGGISESLKSDFERRLLTMCERPQQQATCCTSSTLQPLVDVVTATLSPNSVANGMLSFSRLDAPLAADPLLACAATKQRVR